MKQFLLITLVVLNLAIVGVLVYQMMKKKEGTKKVEKYEDEAVYGVGSLYQMSCPEYHPCKGKRDEDYLHCMEQTSISDNKVSQGLEQNL